MAVFGILAFMSPPTEPSCKQPVLTVKVCRFAVGAVFSEEQHVVHACSGVLKSVAIDRQ